MTESFLPIPDENEWAANFELTLQIAQKNIELRELDDRFNDALDAAYAADREAASLAREVDQAKGEIQKLMREMTRRENLGRRVQL